MTVDDYLSHYGVVGMKWGVTRRRGADGLVSGSPIKIRRMAEKQQSQNQGSKQTQGQPSQQKTSVNSIEALKKKKLSELTDQELRDLSGRMQLEKQYKELTKPKPGVKALIKESLTKAGKQTLANFIENQTKKVLDKYAVPKVEDLFGKLTGIKKLSDAENVAELLTKDLSKLSNKELSEISKRAALESVVDKLKKK